MKFYKVPVSLDQTRVLIGNTASILIAGELITEKELSKIVCRRYNLQNVLPAVDVPKNKTYWFFGARKGID